MKKSSLKNEAFKSDPRWFVVWKRGVRLTERSTVVVAKSHRTVRMVVWYCTVFRMLFSPKNKNSRDFSWGADRITHSRGHLLRNS